MINGGHVWDWNGPLCKGCGCTREEYEDGLRPCCSSPLNSLALFRVAAASRWNGFVRTAANYLLIRA
jgi:hypothetical protein